MKFLHLFLALMLLAPSVWASESPSGAEREIEQLINAVRTSGQTFVRNGTAYPATEAADHLAMKYGRVKSHIQSAEDFIEKAATQSSATGQPYLIRAADGTTVPAGEWLHKELARLRSATPASEANK